MASRRSGLGQRVDIRRNRRKVRYGAETVRVEDQLEDVQEQIEARVPDVVVFDAESARRIAENDGVADRRVGQNVRQRQAALARRATHHKGPARLAHEEFHAFLSRHAQSTPRARRELALFRPVVHR